MNTAAAIANGLYRTSPEETDAANQRWLEENGFRPFFETRKVWVTSRNEMDFLLNTWIKELANGWRLVATLQDGKWSAAITGDTVGKWLDMNAFTARSPRAENAVNMAMAIFNQFTKDLEKAMR